MVDLSALDGSMFNAKEWINSSLKDFGDSNDKERNVSSLIAKCQLHYQQINSEVNNTSRGIMNNLPRIVHEIETIANEAAQLKMKMMAVKQEITNVERNTGSSIASIEKIDRIKVELVNAKHALYEADNWTLLSNDIEAVFEAGDIDVISSKLLSMQQSLNALVNSSDYEMKKAQLEGLKNRLEALTSPYVVEAMGKKMVDQSKRFVHIFEDMGRFPLLVKYYSKCQKVNLMQHWRTVIDLDTEENMVESLQNYYEFLIENWQEQLKWCREVMPKVEPVNLLSELYTDVLTNLSQDLSQNIDVYMKRIEEPLPWLLQVKTCSKNFAASLKMKASGAASFNLARSIYLFLSPHISKYGTYQKAYFAKQLSSLPKSIDVMENIQALGQLNSKIASIATDQFKLCQQLTEGCSMPSFVIALEFLFNSYLETYKSSLASVKGLETKNSHVNTFQMCITLLENLGEITMYIKQIDGECIEAIANNNLAKNGTFESFPQLLLDNQKQNEFSSLIESINDAPEPTVLKNCYVVQEQVCREVYQTSFMVIFAPIAVLLETVPSVAAWKANTVSSDLPDYSYSPQEYITQIGQYLMNLPQLLEPFSSLENSHLNTALSSVSGEGTLTEEAGFVELFLARITETTCRTYCEQILVLSSLGNAACKQLITDITYLGNVLEDLGFSLSEKLGNILQLIKLSPSEYGSQSSGLPPQLVAAIRQMRNILAE